jgi:hypothetical protein
MPSLYSAEYYRNYIDVWQTRAKEGVNGSVIAYDAGYTYRFNICRSQFPSPRSSPETVTLHASSDYLGPSGVTIDVPARPDMLNEAFYGATWRVPSSYKGNASSIVSVPCP